MASNTHLPENISAGEFKHLLALYPDLVESISATKGSKPGQKSLSELDEFRYSEAIGLFNIESPKRAMNLDDVKVLVDWKLRHGKFRPTLMKLVSSNEEQTARDTISAAMKEYLAKPNASAALDSIAKLRGIGPATASLLLSVHDPKRVIFFSDEAFYWLCCDGKKSPIKYNAKEYRKLNSEAQRVIKRLGVSATDVEKVAYVVMKQDDGPEASAGRKERAHLDVTPTKVPEKPKTKRKEEPEIDNPPNPALRRSKRGKTS